MCKARLSLELLFWTEDASEVVGINEVCWLPSKVGLCCCSVMLVAVVSKTRQVNGWFAASKFVGKARFGWDCQNARLKFGFFQFLQVCEEMARGS